MTAGAAQRATAGGALLLGGLLLACQPYLSDSYGEVATEPVAWQCPTPSPVPTVIIGYEPTATPVGPEEPIFSTPVPTATPYIRTGSDFYLNQRVRRGPVIISVVGYRASAAPPDAAPTPRPDAPPPEAMALHLIEVQVENTSADAVELHPERLSVIRTIRRPDGHVVEGTWYPTTGAAQAAGLAPITGQWGPGLTRATIAIAAPAGSVETWGMPFVGSAQRRSGPSGDGYVWVQFQPDPHCALEAGGPPIDAYRPPGPAGTPVAGRGGWPVPPGTTISRGYGCHPFYTGVRGACPGNQWWHDGVDFAAPAGTPLYAVRDLTIAFAGADTGTMDCSAFAGSQPPHTGFGLYVRATDAQGYTYWYGHTQRVAVQAGQRVVAGSQVAAMGSTGCSTGPHLHLRVRLGGVDRDPFDVLEEH